MLGLDLTFIITILNTWLRLTFFEISIDKQWNILRVLGISFDRDSEADLVVTARDYNLFYWHSSPYLAQLDIFFINVYTKFKK
tara:strand:- start:271 stop:519 length:249 start_codon:yes stop_codon:yes gene_type:complete